MTLELELNTTYLYKPYLFLNSHALYQILKPEIPLSNTNLNLYASVINDMALHQTIDSDDKHGHFVLSCTLSLLLGIVLYAHSDNLVLPTNIEIHRKEDSFDHLFLL